ncbi:MAG: hypothetical protein K2K55_01410 [Duncaniella sp.]|nr:hypothetical protein [Duncaniella sp.]
MTAEPGKRRRVVRRKFNPLKALRLLVPIGFFVFLCVIMCTPGRRSNISEEDIYEEAPRPTSRTEVSHAEAPADYTSVNSVDEIMTLDTVSQYLDHLEDMPGNTQRIKVNYFGDMRKVFNDSNYIHWAEAEKIGIEPLTDTRSHWKLSRPITKVTSCSDFFIDELRYSRPFLVPEAAATLHEIGRRFRDTLAVRGGGDYRIKVTSLLRTPSTIRRLRRVNRNSIDSSVHKLATTFDISYASFIADSEHPARSADDLKGILGEVLRSMREEGKIYVKYERGQPCFHITARPRKEN